MKIPYNVFINIESLHYSEYSIHIHRWIEVLQKAVLGEIAEEDEPSEEKLSEDKPQTEEADEEGDLEIGDDSSSSHQAPPIDTPSDTPSDATQSPSKESSQEQPHLIPEEDESS